MTEEDEIVVNWQPGWEDDDTPPATWHDEPPPTGAQDWGDWDED